MRTIALAALLTLWAAWPSAAQTRPAPGFSFDICFNRCLQQGNSAASCQPRCTDRGATLARIPPGAPRSPNDDPRSPRYHDPEPGRPAW